MSLLTPVSGLRNWSLEFHLRLPSAARSPRGATERGAKQRGVPKQKIDLKTGSLRSGAIAHRMETVNALAPILTPLVSSDHSHARLGALSRVTVTVTVNKPP